jgi:hypothetical protein
LGGCWTRRRLHGRTDPNRESCIKISLLKLLTRAHRAIAVCPPSKANEQAIRGNADEDAHEAFETGRNIGYRAWPLNQRDQKAEDKLGTDVADAIAAILNVVTDPNSDG